MNYMNENQGNCQKNYIGNSADINTSCLTCESEIRADVVLSKENSIRLWGIVRDCEGNIVEHALVKLVEVTEIKGQCVFNGIAHTVSDCQGFYQFDLCTGNPCAKYKVVVGFANTGSEKEICMNNCNPCCDEFCKPGCADSNSSCCPDSNSNSCKKPASSCKSSQDYRC